MAIWLTRGGSKGQFEQKFIQDKKVYATWDGLRENLSKLPSRDDLTKTMNQYYPNAKVNTVRNWVGQVWPFVHEMKKGDLVILPLKSQPVVYIGEITGDYQFDKSAPDPYFHSRAVKWVGESIPRNNFAEDLRYSFGAFMTICRIHRNNAEERIKAMRGKGWAAESISAITGQTTDGASTESPDINIEELADDQISRLIAAKFKGHDLTRLVEAILRAQGYTTYVSPPGGDGGADILAGAGPLGFGMPRLCVEVKSGDAPIDRPTVDKLLGAVTKFGAQEGLFVSWSGFKSNVQREMAASFFKIRLWSQRELLENLFTQYDKLDEDIRAELPLKRIWTVAAQDDE